MRGKLIHRAGLGATMPTATAVDQQPRAVHTAKPPWVRESFLLSLLLAGLAASTAAVAALPVIVYQSYEVGGTDPVVRDHYASYDDPAATGKTAWSHHLSPAGYPSVYSDASGDLSPVSMKVELGLPEYYNGGSAHGWVDLADTFTLANTAPGQVGHLGYLLNGEFSRGIPPTDRDADVLARLWISVGYWSPTYEYSRWERNVLLAAWSCDKFHYPNQTCIQGTTVGLNGSVDIPLMPGEYTFQMGLYVDAYYGWDADFGHTARAYFDLPDGVTMNSGSGVLFQTATPVPEPQTAALLLAGLSALALASRRRRR